MRGGFGCFIGDAEISRFSAYMFGVFLMFPVMAIQAKILPVAAVGRIVVVVVIFMMHGQLMQVFSGEFPAAASTDPGKEAQSLLTVFSHTLNRAALRCGDDLI